MLSTTLQPLLQQLQGKPRDQTMVTTFQSGHGYTQQGTATSTNLNDTSDFVLGTQAVSTVTTGTGAANQIRNTGVGPFNLTSQQVGLWVKVDDVSHLSQLVLYLFSGGGTTNFVTFKYYAGPANNTAQLQSGAWTFMTINLGDVLATTGVFDKTNVTGIQLRAVDDNTSNQVTVRYNGISLFADPSAYFPNGVVTISFDDSFASQYTLARAYMDTYGYPGVAYTICGNVGQPGGWMTPAQLQALRDQNGWEIAAHASTLANHNARFTSLSDGDLELEFFNMQQWLVKHGFHGASHMALPGGQFNAAVLEKAKKYFGSVRTIDGTLHETLRPSDIMKIRAVSSISSFAGGVTATTVNAAIDTAVANRQWLMLVFHDIVTTTPTATTQCLQSDFNAIIDHIHSSGIAVRTVSGVISTMAAPIPPNATTTAVGTVQLAGDLGGTATSPTVTGTHLAAALPIAQGGTGSTTQNFLTIGGDVNGGTATAPQVTATHLASALPVAQGGTGQTALSSAVPQPTSTTAPTSGTSLVLARDDHVHPRYDWQPGDHGYIAWSFDPALAVNSTALATAGTLHVIRLHLPVARSITAIDCYVATAGSGLTTGQCFAALYQGGAPLGTTADQAAAWASSGLKSMPLSGGPFAAAAGDLYAAFWFNGTTGPALARGAGNNVVNSGISAASSRFGIANTGATTAAPGSLATVSAEGLSYWVAIK